MPSEIYREEVERLVDGAQLSEVLPAREYSFQFSIWASHYCKPQTENYLLRRRL
jgi:hypothetical protein